MASHTATNEDSVILKNVGVTIVVLIGIMFSLIAIANFLA